ncbi:hypothetical protein OU792_17695, partial [Algoriphagus sp. NF]|uniref:hypothetical protein n=1 Tax=Algoriphagus sp. NF TaxID=2992756 RepID=UPI00237B2F67
IDMCGYFIGFLSNIPLSKDGIIQDNVITALGERCALSKYRQANGTQKKKKIFFHKGFNRG